MATSTCGCARIDNLFLPCPIHKQMQDDANGLNAAIINHQTAELREENAKLLLQVEQLQKIALAASGVVGYDAHRGPGMCTCDFCTRLRCALTPWAEDQRTDLKRKHDGHVHDQATCTNYLCREALGLPHMPTCTCIVCERKGKV